jgi:hypothetical protein
VIDIEDMGSFYIRRVKKPFEAGEFNVFQYNMDGYLRTYIRPTRVMKILKKIGLPLPCDCDVEILGDEIKVYFERMSKRVTV